ncbi:MAG: hypothetical protein RL013_709 [Bacteroidota bacterium]|jgi:hypothetical protein
MEHRSIGYNETATVNHLSTRTPIFNVKKLNILPVLSKNKDIVNCETSELFSDLEKLAGTYLS